jgi:hypothetical protein
VGLVEYAGVVAGDSGRRAVEESIFWWFGLVGYFGGFSADCRAMDWFEAFLLLYKEVHRERIRIGSESERRAHDVSILLSTFFHFCNITSLDRVLT